MQDIGRNVMANDSNEKPASAANIKAKGRMEAKNVKVENPSEESGQKEYSSGAAAFADFFDKIAKEANRKAQKELEKPKYRFIESLDENETYDDFTMLIHNEKYIGIVNEISKLQESINDMDYEVQIVEDLDCKNVTEESRYYIRIAHKNGVSIHIDLFEYEQKIIDFDFNEQEYMEEKISRITGCINDSVRKIADYAVEYLSYIMYFKGLYTLTYKKVGWEYYNWNQRGWIFKYDKIYSNIVFLNGRGKNKYIEGLSSVEDDGSKLREWVFTTIKLLNRHPYDALILGAGISGIMRQLLPYTKETNININIVSEPASGKSTICHYLLSIFGNPELLEGSFTDTENATEEKRVMRPILPYVIDDRMLKIEGESEKTKNKMVLMDVFREYEGKVKERLGKQFEDEAGERTYGPIISSSVNEMMSCLKAFSDKGQYRRFIELTVNRSDLFDDDTEAKEIEEIAYKEYGLGIEVIIDYIFTLLNDESSEATKIIELFNQIDSEVARKLKEREILENERKNVEKIYGMAHSSKRFTLIILSYQILRKSLLYFTFNEFKEINVDSNHASKKLAELVSSLNDFESFAKNEDLVKDQSKYILEILTDNLVAMLRKKNHSETASKFVVKNLYNYVMAHPLNFAVTNKFTITNLQTLYDLEDNILGYYEINEKQSIELYYVQAFSLDSFWEMNIIPEPDDILAFCREVKEKKFTESVSREYAKEKFGISQDPKKYSVKDGNNKKIQVDGVKKNVKFNQKSIRKDQLQEEGEE